MSGTRLDETFAKVKREGRAALVTFVTAGDPDYSTSLELLRALPAAGADIIELGMPFSDPMADGPAIQASSLRALKAGQKMKKTLAMVREFRETDKDTPIVLMGYYNPIYVYPNERFLDDAAEAGVGRDLEVDGAGCLDAVHAGAQHDRARGRLARLRLRGRRPARRTGGDRRRGAARGRPR